MRPASATAARPSHVTATAPPPVRAAAPATAPVRQPAVAPPPTSPAPRATGAATQPTGTSRAASRASAPAPDRKLATKAPTAPGEQKILFQKFFKSVGPRTYAAQVKEANNGNHFLVVTEGKRDDATGEVRKTRLFVFSEDFVEFFNLLDETARFIKAHPVPAEVEQRRRRFWAKKNDKSEAPPAPAKASK